MCTSTLHTSYTVISKLTFSIFHVHSITKSKHIIYFYIYLFFVCKWKRKKLNSKQTSEWISKRKTHSTTDNFPSHLAKIEAIAISQVFITFMSFPSFYWTKLIRLGSTRFDSIRLRGVRYTENAYTAHTHAHTNTGQAFNADIDTIFSLFIDSNRCTELLLRPTKNR